MPIWNADSAACAFASLGDPGSIGGNQLVEDDIIAGKLAVELVVVALFGNVQGPDQIDGWPVLAAGRGVADDGRLQRQGRFSAVRSRRRNWVLGWSAGGGAVCFTGCWA